MKMELTKSIHTDHHETNTSQQQAYTTHPSEKQSSHSEVSDTDTETDTTTLAIAAAAVVQ